MEQIRSKYYNMTKNDIMSFAYLGKINNDVITWTIGMLEQYLLNSAPLRPFTKRLSFIIVENFQNILRYGNIKGKQKFEYQYPMFLVRFNDSGLYIGSVNIIANDKINHVQDKIKNINSSSYKELTRLYKKILINQTFTSEGGAGLGLIEIARKTRNKIECNFVKLNDKSSYVYIMIRSTNGINKLSKAQDLVDVKWLKSFHYEAISSGLTVFYKGNFYSKMIEPLNNILYENSPKSDIDINHVILSLILEKLNNIILNQPEDLSDKSSALSLTTKNNENIICTSKCIHPNISAKLKTLFDEYYSLSLDTLKQKYENLLSQCSSNSETALDLVIMEIIIETKQKLNYQFTQTDKNKSTQSYSFKY